MCATPFHLGGIDKQRGRDQIPRYPFVHRCVLTSTVSSNDTCAVRGRNIATEIENTILTPTSFPTFAYITASFNIYRGCDANVNRTRRVFFVLFAGNSFLFSLFRHGRRLSEFSWRANNRCFPCRLCCRRERRR